jgi:hypothetical protein
LPNSTPLMNPLIPTSRGYPTAIGIGCLRWSAGRIASANMAAGKSQTDLTAGS